MYRLCSVWTREAGEYSDRLLALATVSLFTFLGYLRQEHAERVEVLSMYWHFVDVVWVVVFIVVYIVGR
jgi:cytochrome c oxidase subunit 3/cytochrome o ubiquinol oxidase subunit 3